MVARGSRTELDQAVHVALLHRVTRNFDPVEAAMSGRPSGPTVMARRLDASLSTGVEVEVVHELSLQ